ncbi:MULTISPECIES: restriction endonuclease subunit S [unclassified Curtobacterium]|uniref:restriction endonuclease subunit S n=1 Tax=unclassified Curtobacterium TaxID=257496 RepID=UPI00104E1679|nr:MULTISPECIES: restriction endonuclease subunit S [unclassified Curtobacterium]TCL73375.1 type I restriction enzyme S subunit [Curtobacterium sp. PhB128]TCL90880.1 type I restriction enzyme S subunit [Curtobacterium sp. PhB138]
MSTLALSEIIGPSGSRAGADSKHPVFSVTKHAGFVPSDEYFKKQVHSRELSGYKRVRPGDFAYATIHLDEGSVGIAPSDGLISPMYTVFAVDADKVVPEYLIRFLKSPTALAQYDRLGRGSVHRRRSISLAALGSLQVPLPPLEEQRRIAATLDQVDALRTKRRQVLDKLDGLVSSQFIEMFGSPLAHREGQIRQRIGSIATVVTGKSPSRAIAANFGQSIEWLKSDNLGGPVATPASEYLSEQGRRRAREVPAGSVLVTCIAGSSKSIGKASIVDRAVTFNQQINAVLPSDNLEPIFLLHQLKVAPELVRNKSTGGMKGLVSKSAFESIEILRPDLRSQQEFVGFAASVEVRRANAVAAGIASDKLFASIQSRAFRGEL